jgi:hypothetical protein
MAEVAVCLSKIRQCDDRSTDQLDRALGISLAYRNHSEQMERVRVAGRLGENPTIAGGGLSESPGPVMPDGRRKFRCLSRAAPRRAIASDRHALSPLR